VARLVLLSFRLGGTDGVSIEAAKWKAALGQLGHDVTEVAGEGPVDVLVPGLAIGAARAPTLDQLERAIAGAGLVIVENLAALPLNIAARDVLYQALDGRAALFHHHDLPWQRDHLSHLEGPRDQPRWRHVTINELSRRQLHERGIEATTLMNSFDCTPPVGRRELTRSALGVGDEVLLLLPTRAIPRKNVEGALELAQSLGAVLWLLGPAEDGYGPELDRLLAATSVEVRRGLVGGASVHDAYAACSNRSPTAGRSLSSPTPSRARSCRTASSSSTWPTSRRSRGSSPTPTKDCSRGTSTWRASTSTWRVSPNASPHC
jgi:hypothetical protein